MKYSVESQSDIGHYFLQREHADGRIEVIARVGIANDAERLARMLNAGEQMAKVLDLSPVKHTALAAWKEAGQ